VLALSLKVLATALIKANDKKKQDQKANESNRQWVVGLFLMAANRSLSPNDTERFVNFIALRFPHMPAEDYIEEWADRFATGHPETWADEKSLNVMASFDRSQTRIIR